MEEGAALAKLGGAGLGAEIAVGAVMPGALETGAQIEGADFVATMAVGAGFFGVGKLHGAGAVGLQQHLDQRIGAAFLAEVFLIVNEETHEPRDQGPADTDDWKVPGGDQPQLIIQRLEKRENDLG